MKPARNSVARNSIYTLISQSPQPLSHAEIQQRLKGLCDRVTTYRILKRLTEEHKIHRIATCDGLVKYACCCQPLMHQYHVHFNCQQCHTITCLTEVRPAFELPQHYVANEVNFTITGICPTCYSNLQHNAMH